MQRIQDATAVTVQPAPPALTGQPVGFFQGSIAGGIVTRIRYWWLNMIQEELIAPLVAANLPLDGSASVLQAIGIIGHRFLDFATPGVTSWTVPAGVYRAQVLVVAGGGGGSGSPSGGTAWSGSGGGAGGWGILPVDVTPGTTYPITVGAAGAAGGPDGSGSAGGSSSFGSLLSASGGQGGNANAGGGFGGMAVGGFANYRGQTGGDGTLSGSAPLAIGTGFGGAGPLAGSGPPGSANNSGAATGPGSGGGGGYKNNGVTGGTGAAGLVRIIY